MVTTISQFIYTLAGLKKNIHRSIYLTQRAVLSYLSHTNNAIPAPVPPYNIELSLNRALRSTDRPPESQCAPHVHIKLKPTQNIQQFINRGAQSWCLKVNLSAFPIHPELLGADRGYPLPITATDHRVIYQCRQNFNRL